MQNIGGIGIAGFKSFGSESQYLRNCGKINILIGQNNSGKSNILSFLSSKLSVLNPALKNPWGEHSIQFRDLEYCHSLGDKHLQFSVGIKLNDDAFQIGNFGNKLPPTLANYGDRVKRALCLDETDQLTWLHLQVIRNENKLKLSPTAITRITKAFTESEWNHLSYTILNRRGGPLIEIIRMLFAQLNPFKNITLPAVEFIPAIREIRPGEKDNSSNHSGAGLVQDLAALERPRAERSVDKLRFEKINEFVREVTGRDDAAIEIPHDRSTINVSMDGRYLPLASVGTGIHEIIILAAKCTVFDQKIVCIEEPEIHVHPILQRKFLRYIYDKTDNQYFIATHSAHFLETVKSSIYHVRLREGCSNITIVQTNNEKSEICKDLGYRPSDLIQTNCIVWVEGPSDRLYIKHWIHLSAPELIEGIHYSIMFYGGRLLSHLSASDTLVTEFIELRKLNRFVALVMDSDKQNQSARLNATKRRVRDELHRDGGLVWVTKGREIENYIDRGTLTEAVASIRQDATIRYGQYEQVWRYRLRNGKPAKNPDKMAIARAIIKRQVELRELDVKRQVKQLVEFVKKANLEK